MKRRLFTVLICCVLLFLLTIHAYAAGTKEYTLDALGMTVSMPSDYIVFLRDIDVNDPNLSAYGLTKDSMSSLMNERNIYLNGWDAEINHEIIITMIDSPLVDFNLYSDTILSTMATSLKSEYESTGVSVIKTEIYQHSQAKFLKIYISQPYEGSTVYGLQYYTVYADKAINITMQSYLGQITASQEAVIKSVVDSAEFDTAPQTAKANSLPTDPFTYTDTKTKATFVVPANWVEMPLTEERKSIDVKFSSLEEDGMSIMYGSFDLWNEMTTSERSGHNRSDIDNSFLTKSDIADVFGVESNEIKSVTYGGNEYYTATATSNTDALGLSFTITMTHMICIENGYMHWFQFSGEKSNKLYGDFESLLISVNLPLSTSKEYPETGSNPLSQFSLRNILVSLIVTILVYSLPIFIFRYAIRKEPLEKKKAKKITILYGICAFIIMSALIFAINGSGAAGGAILLWSWVNYRVLTGGKMKAVITENVETATAGKDINELNKITIQSDNSATSVPCDMDSSIHKEVDTTLKAPKVKYCRKCGHELIENSDFCSNCGTQIVREQ